MNKKIDRQKRARRGRKKIQGTASRPRLCVFRSSRYIFAQLINDEKGTVIAALDSRKIPAPKGRGLTSGGKGAKDDAETARKVGAEMAKVALAKKVKEIVFDRSGYKYHGKVKALAEGAREGGLVF